MASVEDLGVPADDLKAGTYPSVAIAAATKIAAVTAPNVGENPVAFRRTVDAAGKSPAGTFAFTQVYTGVEDTVVTLSFVAAQADQVEELTRVAVDRAGTVLGWGSRPPQSRVRRDVNVGSARRQNTARDRCPALRADPPTSR